MKASKKSALTHDVIEKLKTQKTYFSYEEIKALLEKEKIEITPSSLKSYVYELTQKKIIFDAGKGWYSTLERDFILNKKPIQQITRKLKVKLPLLEFSCWSTEQINSFTHHLLTKFITFVYTDTDFINNTAEHLENAGYTVFKNPDKAEIKKHFKIASKTVVLRPNISKQPETIENYAPIEKILVDLLIENRKLSIMEDIEAEGIVNNALNFGKINISAFFSYAKRREFHIPKSINQIQINIIPEIVDR